METIAQYKKKLLDEFEQREDEWTFGHFENRLREIRKGTNYQDAKGIIIEAHEIGEWNKTVKRYVLTNYSSFGNVSSELNSILQDVYSSLSSEDKKDWKID